jgi:CPA2 family monovalent cation:H+ antiporter-2
MEHHLPSLISDLALILLVGAVTTLIFKKIKQPLVLGYIIAGFLVGPHFSLMSTVTDVANIDTWAKIGVIFLLFSLGLEFSFKKLKRVGGEASITGFIEIVFIAVAGYFTGKLLGWTTMDSLFLGGMLASSSTTIIIKAFDELGVKTQRFAQVVFGVLIIEDLVVILLMVLLSTVAVTKQFEGSEMIFTIGKLVFFLVLWFIGGIFLIPSLLKKAKKILDDETLLVLAVALCLLMVVIATKVGFSAELGAFIMGSILAETIQAEKIEQLTKPIKNFFGAVFFISVGMLIDPQLIANYAVPVLIITAVMILGKMLSTAFGAMLSGQPLKQSLQVGMSMAQVGEFAFIVASLGLTLGVTSDFLFPVAVGVSAISTFTTPYMIRFSPKFYDFIIKIIPNKWTEKIGNYSESTQRIRTEKMWKKTLGGYLTIMFTNGIIIVAILLICFHLLFPLLQKILHENIFGNIILLAIVLALISPFLMAFVRKRPNNMAYTGLWLNREYSHGPLLTIEIVRNVIGLLLLGFVVSQLFSNFVALVFVTPITLLTFWVFHRQIKNVYLRIETHFLKNLNARGEEATQQNGHHPLHQDKISLWNAHLVDLEIKPEAEYVGSKLTELNWRKVFGINIAYIRRGEKLIYAPQKSDMILPFDHVGIIGTDEQLQEFKPFFDRKETIDEYRSADDIVFQSFVINENNPLCGKTIAEANIRELTDGLIIGIERNGEKLINPKATERFEKDDLVWVVGDRKKIHNLNATKIN